MALAGRWNWTNAAGSWVTGDPGTADADSRTPANVWVFSLHQTDGDGFAQRLSLLNLRAGDAFWVVSTDGATWRYDVRGTPTGMLNQVDVGVTFISGSAGDFPAAGTELLFAWERVGTAAPGPEGPPGPAGADSTVPGPAGSDGPAGPMGPTALVVQDAQPAPVAGATVHPLWLNPSAIPPALATEEYVDEVVTVSELDPVGPPARDGLLWIVVAP